METIYTKRRDGTVDHKIFWGPIDADFESEMRELVSTQNIIKKEFVEKRSAVPEIPGQDILLSRIEKFLDDRYICNGKYPVEMFLYSLKRTSGLMPERGPGSKVSPEQLEIEKYYIDILADRLSSALENADNPEEDPSIMGLCHVLRDWPRYGSWKKALFVAVSVVERINEELDFLNQTIAEFLSDEVLWECAFSVLTTRKQYKYNIKRLELILLFLTEAGNSKSSAKNTIFGKAIPEFRKLLRRLMRDDPDMYGELYMQAYLDLESPDRNLPYMLVRAFNMEAGGPEGLRNAVDQTVYIRENFSTRNDTWSIWQKWMWQLEDEKQFKVLCDIYETDIYPNSTDYDKQSKILCAMGVMRDKTLGAAYLHKLNSPTFGFPPRGEVEMLIRKAALFLADGSGNADDLMDLFESLQEFDRIDVFSTMKALYNNPVYRGKLKQRIDALTSSLDMPEEEIIDKVKLLDDYMRIIPKMRDKLADHKALVKKLMNICGYSQETGELNSTDIPFRKLDCVITLINDAITRDSREEYRALLYALLNTRERSAVASLMKDIWSGEE